MKQIKLKVIDSSLKEVLGGEFTVNIDDEADILELIKKFDATRKGQFFIKNYPRAS
jgi:hypothetical protein